MRLLPDFLRSLDPRLKVLSVIGLGISVWHGHFVPVGALGLLLLCCSLALVRQEPRGRLMAQGMAVFVLFWMLLKGGLDVLFGLTPFVALILALELGLRLGVLMMLGLCLALSTSPARLGLALAWFARPFGRERAWKLALSLSLMVHFLPLGLRTLAGIRQTMQLRCPNMSFFQRMRLMPQALLRTMGRNTWDQTLAVAGRRLDRPEAWKARFSWHGRDWAVLSGMLAAVAMLVVA